MISIDPKVVLGENVIIYENTRIDGNSVIGDNVTIFPNTFINNSKIGKGTKVYSSFIENSEIGACCSVGAYCCIKTGSKVSNFVKIGSNVTIKNSIVGEYCEIGHSSVLCGAALAKRCKVSAGSVFAGHCEKNKPKIEVGADCIIGARSLLIEPLSIKSGTTIFPGTIISEEINYTNLPK